jgi:hypothetical protein
VLTPRGRSSTALSETVTLACESRVAGRGTRLCRLDEVPQSGRIDVADLHQCRTRACSVPDHGRRKPFAGRGYAPRYRSVRAPPAGGRQAGHCVGRLPRPATVLQVAGPRRRDRTQSHARRRSADRARRPDCCARGLANASCTRHLQGQRHDLAAGHGDHSTADRHRRPARRGRRTDGRRRRLSTPASAT